MPISITILPKCITWPFSLSRRSCRSTSPSRRRCSVTTRRRRTASPSARPLRSGADHRGVPHRRPGRTRCARAGRHVLVPGFDAPPARPAGPSSAALVRRRSAARAWPRSAPARSPSPPPACSTAAAHHPLARRRRSRRRLPARSRRARRALRRRGRRAHLRGRRLRPRPLPAHPAPDHGAALASHIARRLVVPPHREGGQAQYVDQPLPTHAGGSLAATRAGRSSASTSPSRSDLAAHAHVSERTFARRFTAETGVPVLRWLLARRVDAARAALESTDATIDEIADTLRLRHRREPPQALPPPRLHHPDGLPPHLHP